MGRIASRFARVEPRLDDRGVGGEKSPHGMQHPLGQGVLGRRCGA